MFTYLLQAEQNELDMSLLETQNVRLQEYLKNVRSKLVTGLNLLPIPAAQDVYREENFDACLNLLGTLYRAQGTGENVVKATIENSVDEVKEMEWKILMMSVVN